MSDDFLALFGSATLDDKDDLDPRPSDPGAGDALVLARVVTCIDLQCVVELPDGRKTLVDQVIFDHVAPDSIVPVFRLPEGGWSLVAPHWSLPGRPVASLSFVRGQKVFLEIDAYDEHLDALVGHVEQQRALVPRSLLPWPACSPEMDLTPLIGGGADLIVVNPIGEPIVLGAHTTYLPSGMPLARLYSLQTLSTLAPNISVRVVSVAAQKLTVAYMGQNFTVFREDQGWTKTNSFRDGQLIDARLSVDLKAGRAFISVRRPSDPEWSEVRRRFPLGMIVTRADAVSATGRGFVLDLLDKNFDVFGLVPLHQLGPWKLVSQFEHHSPPLPLQIIGYLEDRCILVLGLAPYITTCWELTRPTVGHQIPLYLSNWNNLPTIAMWGPGCLATCTTNADKEQFAWGMVMESDPLERKLLVSPLGAERRGHRVFAGQNGDAVTFDDGVVGKFAGPLRTRKHSDGLDTTLVAVRFHSNPAVAVVDVRDEHTDRSWAELKRRFRRNESVMASITASMQGGFVGRVYGESLFPELQSDQSSSYGIAVFLPIQNSTFHEQVASDDSVVGKIVEVGIVEWDESAQRCVVSQKMATPKGSLLPGTQRELLAQFHVGDQVVGVINNIVEYGIFVSINGVDGLIHQTDISYEKGEIRKLIIRLGLYIGQEIAAKVIKIDLDKCRLSLGLKQLHPDPWEEFCTQDHIGTCCQGTVTNLVDYGIFLEIAPGIEGLVHFTELTWQIPQPHPSSLFRIGDVVEVRIEDIDFDKRRISLSRNQLSPCVMKAFSTMHPLGAQMTGRIVKFADRGASVVLSPGVKCCLPVTEFAGDTEELKEGDAVRIFLGPMDAKERLMSISFAKRVPRFSDIGTLRQGLIVDGSVSGRDRHDVMIKIHGTEVVGKLSRANLAPFLEGTDNLPDGTGVVVELVSDPSAASDLRMDLRDVMRPERFISLPKKILSPSFQTLSATHALRKDQVYSIYCHVVGENAPVFDEPLTANDFMAMTSALTKSRQKVSLQVLSSLHALNKDQVCTIYRQVVGQSVPSFDEPLSANDFVAMTLALPKSCTLTLPKSRQTVPLQALSSLHALNKDQVCTIYRQFVGENVPSFDEPLNVQDFKAMTVALANLSQVAEGKVIGAGKADSLVEGIAPFETCSPDRKLSKPDKDELVASTPAAFADQEELNSPPVSISALASDNVSTVPGYSALRRLIVNQRLSKSDLEEGDSALDSMLVNQLDCVEQEVCSDTIELQDCWMEWTESGTARPEFLFSLIESGLTALAGLIDLRTVVGRVPPNGSGLTELAAIARVMPTDGKAATAQMVDTILRCLLVAPDDVLPWGILGRAVPSNWLLSHIESIDQWVLRNMRQPIITPNMGRCVVVARATAALGDLRSAHKILGDWLRHSDSIDLRRERTALAERYRQNIVAERYFFDRWTRRSNADVGKGSFALVLPVIDSSNGEQHALKHSLLLAAIGNDQRASEFLFDREARLLKDLGGLDGVPQFVARPSDEALVCHWIDGQTLAELKSRGGAGAVWTHQDVAHLGGRLATVLSHIAERLPGFVHNDLAPRNIMLPGGRPEEAVLIDLGLAAHSAHSMMTIVDELDLDLRATYQAPEVRDGEVGTARSDMYSLGLLLLEMLLPGELPPAVPSAVQDALRRTRLSSGSAASQRLADVLGRLLNQIANHRPKSWHEVSYDMSKVLNG